jgi:hypothetical protein
LLGLLLILFSLRLKEKPRDWRNAVGWGLAAGVGWWLGPMIAFYAVACLGWLLWQARSNALLRALGLAIPSFFIGALPWIIYNVPRGFPSLKSPPLVGTYLDHVRAFFVIGTPIVFDLRVSNADSWLPPRDVGAFLCVAIGGLLAWQAVRLARARSPLSLALLPGVIAIIFLPLTSSLSIGRYIYYLVPIGIAVLASAMRDRRAQAVVAVLVIAANVLWFNKLGEFQRGVTRTLTTLGSQTVGAAAGDREIVQRLEGLGLTRLYADYWYSYNYDYLSDEHLIITPLAIVRSDAYDNEVASSPDPSYMFPLASARVLWMKTRLQHMGVTYETHRIENVVVITPRRHVVPADLLPNRIALSEYVSSSMLPKP